LRVAVIFHRFGPYHCARLEAAAGLCEIVGIEIAAETQEYAWSPAEPATNYSRMTLFPKGDTRTMPAKRVADRLEGALRRCAPSAVAIPGWSNNAAVAALRWCAGTGTPAILMSESSWLDHNRVRVREWIKRRIVALYSTALVGGRSHIDYLVQLGMPRDRVFTGYDVVDSEYFRRATDEIRGQQSEFRQRYKLPGNYFLASARFIQKKNLVGLIRAYARYREMTPHGPQTTDNRPWDLVLLGDGPLRETLNSQLSTLNLHAYVHLPGFKQYDELPVYYALANAFVHASTTEQWGLVVNEAIASGLPIIVSSRCGCVPELVKDNGFAFDPDNEQQLASLLCQMASLSGNEREQLGRASRSIAAMFEPKQFGEGLKQAAELAIALPRKRLGMFDHTILSAAMRYRG
jgi:1,2-diacylglycerol 3-alpha-glucosyltransferase